MRYLGDQFSISVSDSHEAMLDVGRIPKLVQLSDADDARLELGDPVHVHKLAMALAADGEEDHAAAKMSTTEPSPKRTLPDTETSPMYP
jgi:hypothetical protein